MNVIDLEMTGFFTGRQICEISAHKIRDGEIVGHFHRYVNPNEKINPVAKKMHGLNREFLANHPPIENVWKDLTEFLGDEPICAHHATADFTALSSDANIAGLSMIENEFYCTAKMASQWGLGQISLKGLANHFGLEATGLHKAKNDSRILAEILCALYRGQKPKNIEMISPPVLMDRPHNIEGGLIKWTCDGMRRSAEIPDFPNTHTLLITNAKCVFVVEKGKTVPDNPWGPCIIDREGETFDSILAYSGKQFRDYIFTGEPVAFETKGKTRIKVEVTDHIEYSVTRKGREVFRESIDIPDYPDDYVMIVRPCTKIMITPKNNLLREKNPLGFSSYEVLLNNPIQIKRKEIGRVISQALHL